MGLDPGRVLSLYSELLLSVAKEGGLGDRPTIYTMGGGAEEHAPRMFAGRATIVKGLRHPQWLLDFERTIWNLESRAEEIRAREYEPGKEWSVVDPLESLRLHDAVASRVLSVLAGKPVTYTGGMDLYNNTNGAREKLRALRDDLLGALGMTASLVHKKQCDLAHFFARLAERDHPVPPHISGEARDEFLRLTSLASVDPSAARRCAFLSDGASVMDCSPDAPDAGSSETPSSLKEWYDAIPEEVRAEALKFACNTKVVRFEQSLRAIKGHQSRGHHSKADLSVLTLERVFGTTDVEAINALSEEEYQDALTKVGLGKAAKTANAASVAKAQAKRKDKLHAQKEANNGTNPKFKGDESCPSGFEAIQRKFPTKFRAHLPKCESCRKWAYRVSQLQAAPVGAFPSTLTVVKRAAKLQEKGVKFLGRIDVADFTARHNAAKPKKRRGAKGAAPAAKRPKK